MSLARFIAAAPKAELHVHLEGAIRPETLLVLARRNHVSLPADDAAGLRRWFTFTSFARFVEVYVTIARCLRTAADYELIVTAFAAEQARQNVRYVEATFSPSMHHTLGVPRAEWTAGLRRGRERALSEYGVRINWIFDIVRDRTAVARGDSDVTLAAALDGMADGVVALGLGGTEPGNPPEVFAPYFERARTAGMHSVPHAGELAGPESVWGALRVLGAERIEHGVRAIDDPVLVAHLARTGIALDICPTSNLRLGVVPSLAQHPLPALLAAGVPVTINSDDPPLFNTTLLDEAALLAEPFGLALSAVRDILLNGVRHSFLPAPEKQSLLATHAAEMDTLARGVNGEA